MFKLNRASMQEFFRLGSSPVTMGEIMSDLYREIDDDASKRMEEIKNDHGKIIRVINKYLASDPQVDDPIPQKVLSVVDVSVSYGLRRNKEEWIATVQCYDGVYKFVYGYYQSYGSYWEPPENEEEMTWEKL